MVGMQQGSVVIKQPLPPGCLVGVWRDPQRFHSAYMAAYPGYYLTGSSSLTVAAVVDSVGGHTIG